MTGIGTRLQQSLDEIDMSQNELARRLGLRQSTLSALIKGKSAGSKHILRIAREVQQDPEWLESASGHFRTHKSSGGLSRISNRSSPSIVQIEGDEFARLPLFEMRVAAGRSSLAYDAVEPKGYRLFDLSWLKSVSRAPLEMLRIIEVHGDSMEPTLYKGDHVLVDLANQSISEHGLFVLRLDDSLMVKRLQKKFKTGSVSIISDNPKYAAEEVSEPDELVVLGRVIWVGRSV